MKLTAPEITRLASLVAKLQRPEPKAKAKPKAKPKKPAAKKATTPKKAKK